VTRDDLELVCGREGLTRPQTQAVLDAADRYATTQARHAIDALYPPKPDVHYYVAGARTACGLRNENLVNTTRRRQVTCDACKEAMP
jgi:hypothetical protein